MIFLPLWLLGLISLGIFFQERTLADRIASIATVMIAHVAFMPVIRGQLPPSPKLTFTEILVYMEISITLFCLIESIANRGVTSEFEWNLNGLFMVSFIIQCLETAVIILLIIIYYCCWFPSYNLKPGMEIPLDTKQWYNLDCDVHINEKMKLNGFNVYELK